MAGYVKRPSLKDIKFDLKGLKLIKEYALQSKGDDKFYRLSMNRANVS